MAKQRGDCDRIARPRGEQRSRGGRVAGTGSGSRPGREELIDDGVIGDVRMIRVIGPTAGYDAPDDKWKFDPDEQTVYAIGQRMLATSRAGFADRGHHRLCGGPFVHTDHRPTRVSFGAVSVRNGIPPTSG